MIKYIWVDDWTDYSSDNNQDYLKLERLNIFIGRNNSGKSRLLRLLFSSNLGSISYISSSDNLIDHIDKLTNLSNCLPKGSSINGINGEAISSILKRETHIVNHSERIFLTNLDNELNRIINGNQQPGGIPNLDKIIRDTRLYIRENNKAIFSELELDNLSENRIYIPILRGMRPIGKSENDHEEEKIQKDRYHGYIERTNKDYFSNIQHARESIHTGENLYQLLTEHLLGLPEQRERIKEYENLLSINFFEGKEVTLIPKHDNDVVNVKISNEDQRPIHELGDGLQHIIITTSIAYLTESPSIIIIEEPENCLHPGLLRQLINFLLNETNHQYFVTTHSNHMLEFADEKKNALIHKLTKTTDGNKLTFNISTVSKDRNLLIDLGVKSSSLYLSNCTIWVEGITDRLYLKTFIKKYLSHLEQSDKEKLDKYNKYMENYHYSFVEYQGGNLSHWTFNDDIEDETINEIRALSVNSNVLLIADGDISSKGKRAERFNNELKENFYLLPGKEIENLIPEEVIKSVTKEMFSTFRRNTYGKNINDIDKIKYKNYVDSPDGIGYHIDRKLGLSGKGKSDRTNLIFADNSGTISDKMKFCTLSTRKMDDLETWEITNEIIDLCEKIFDHIEKHNYI